MSRSEQNETPFFVGYLPVPKALVGFLAVIVGAVVGGGLVVAAAFALGQGGWGDASFKWGDGYQTRAGILQVAPYPVLYVAPDDDYPNGRAVVLSGQGKRGVQRRAEALDGKPTELAGIGLGRSEVGIEFIQVGGRVKLGAAEEGLVPAGWQGPEPVDLGDRTLSGELVDSKCYLGAMRPGQGKTHKLCANLCVIGGIPPMFVVYREVGDPLVMLLADSSGGPVPEAMLNHTSHYVELSGRLERRADLLVFKVDPASPRRLQERDMAHVIRLGVTVLLGFVLWQLWVGFKLDLVSYAGLERELRGTWLWDLRYSLIPVYAVLTLWVAERLAGLISSRAE